MDKIEIEKKKIRKEIRKKRDELDASFREKANLVILDQVLGHNFFYKAKKVLIYKNFESEVDTENLMKQCLKYNKEVYLPMIVENKMLFKQIVSLSQLEEGYHKIQEPIHSKKTFQYDASDCDHTLVIIPGLVFDTSLNRMGYGKGFYDTFLANNPFNMKLALAYSVQILEQIPTIATDIKMDVIITEKLKYGGFYA